MVAGGADAPLRDAVIRLTLARHPRLPRRPTPVLPPVDVTRDGTLIGEGRIPGTRVAGVRPPPGREGSCKTPGLGDAADTTHRASPREDGEGLVRAMRRSCASAGSTRRRSTMSTPTEPGRCSTTGSSAGHAASAGRSRGPGGVQLDQAGHGALPGRVVCPGSRHHDPQPPTTRSPRPRPTASTSTQSVASTS